MGRGLVRRLQEWLEQESGTDAEATPASESTAGREVDVPVHGGGWVDGWLRQERRVREALARGGSGEPGSDGELMK